VAQAENLDALVGLLPFYANGTLGADDRALMDFALTTSIELRAELEVVQQLGIMVHIGGNAVCEGLSNTSAERLTRLMARIDTGASKQDASYFRKPDKHPLDALRNWLAGMMAPQWALAATVCLVALFGWQAGRHFGGSPPGPTDQSYQGAAGPEAPAPKRISIVIQPAANASPQAIDALLASEGLTMIQRDDDGLIALRANKRLSPSEVEALVKRLRASPLIAFAGAGA
jgi:hypothetical protein